MCTTPSGSEGGGEVPFCPQVARLQRGHPRLLLRVSPSETPLIHHHPNGCFANGNAANG